MSKLQLHCAFIRLSLILSQQTLCNLSFGQTCAALSPTFHPTFWAELFMLVNSPLIFPWLDYNHCPCSHCSAWLCEGLKHTRACARTNIFNISIKAIMIELNEWITFLIGLEWWETFIIIDAVYLQAENIVSSVSNKPVVLSAIRITWIDC